MTTTDSGYLPASPEAQATGGGWDDTEVRLGTTGNLWRAPVGTPAPVDTAALVTPWVNLGYATDDGFTAIDNYSKTDIMVWQSFYPVRSKVTSTLEFKFKLVQDNPETWMLAFGGGAVDVTGIYTPPAPGSVYENAFALDVIDGADLIRYTVARAIVSNLADVIHKSDEAVAYELTITVLGTSAGSPWTRIVSPIPALAAASTTGQGGGSSSSKAA
jgi:hypothetical protein